jgi:ribosomal 50S subunit-recycling heat shock protein
MKLQPKGRRRRVNTAIGTAMKQRRKIGLYLTGCRQTRRKQLRRCNKRGGTYQKLISLPDTSVLQKDFVRYEIRTKGQATLIERRVDALLVRAHFCKTVFQARQWAQHGKIMLNGKAVKRPNQVVGNLIPLTLNLMYRLKRKKELTDLFTRGKASRFTTYPPISYMYVDYVLMLIYCLKATEQNAGRTHMHSARKTGAFTSLSR